VLGGLDALAGKLVELGVRANAVTGVSLALAAIGGVLLAVGHLGAAWAAMVAASCGDAVDGFVARRARSTSVGGALLDASADRYQEVFFFGGLMVLFHDSIAALVLALFALAGSFMVSYGSAKAEALAVAVPPGVMRRAERAVCLCAGVGLAALFAWAARARALPPWAARATLVATLAVIAVAANVSAIMRLRRIARGPFAVVALRGDGPGSGGPAHVLAARSALAAPQRRGATGRGERARPRVARRWPG
jgi:CDP-diacylglycerol--glycerol-3-phosphate 3-phosphatidyltransferase